MRRRGLRMPPYWRGGVPVERGPYPAVIEWRPQRETTDNPELFQGWISDIEAVLATAGLSLVTQQSGSGRIIYTAAGHRVAELQKTMSGMKGTVFARPVGGPGPGARGQVAAEEIRRSSTWLGYGQARPGISPALVVTSEEPEYHLAPSVREEMYRATALRIRPIEPAPFVPSTSSKAKTIGGLAVGGIGILGGIATLLAGKGLGRGAQIGSGIASAAAAVTGPILTASGVKQRNREREAYEEEHRKGVAEDVEDVLPTLPQTEIIDEALSRCSYLRRAILLPGMTMDSPSGVTPMAGDWEATIYDRERKTNYTVLCSDFPRDGMRELVGFYTSDPGAGMASVKNEVSFVDDPTHFYRWGRGEKIPGDVRDQIWALPILREESPTQYAVARYVQNLAASMNRPLPRYALCYSGEYGGSLVRTDRAFLVQTNLWRDVMRSVVLGLVKMAAAIIIGFLGAGPVGSALAAVGIGVSVVVAEIIAIVGYVAYEAYRIIQEVRKTGKISGSMEDAYRVFALLASSTETVRGYVAQFEHEIYQVMSYIDTAKSAGRLIQERYGELVSWVNGIDDNMERMGAQMVVGAEGGLANFASRINGYPKDQIPWSFPDGGIRLIEAKVEGAIGTLP